MKRLLLAICLVTLAFGTLQATVIPVENTVNNSLSDAIAAATAGDIIELITDGDYLSTSQIVIDKDLTIRGLETLANKPVLKYIGTSTGAYMFKGVGSSHIEFHNLELDGDGTAEGGAALAKYAFRLDNGDPTMTMDLFMDNCHVHDFNEKFIKPYGNTGLDSLVITNTVFHDGAREGIVLYSGSTSDPAVVFAYAEISNCTFYAIEREAIKGDTYVDGVVRIDRITAYDCGSTQNKPMIYFRDMTDVIVTNSIFANNTNPDAGEEFAEFDSDLSLFNHNCVWDIVNSDVSAATVSDTIHTDPQFTDAANGDFSIPEASVLYFFADDGGAIGDSRWAPVIEATVIQISNAAPNALADAISAAAEGDIIELISDGVYTNDSQIVLDQDITIRGSSNIPNRPVVKYNGTSTGAYMFKGVGSPHLVIKNLELDGDGTAEGGAALAKYAFRLDNGDPTMTMDLFMDNCHVHDFNEKFIKPYGNTGLDSLVITNTVFHDGAREGIVLYSGSTSDPAVVFAYAEISNCTFYAIEREAIKGDTYVDGVVRIDRITAYDCGSTQNKPMIYFRDMTDVIVTNSIFANNTNPDAGEEFAEFDSDLSLFNHNCVWDIVNSDVSAATVSDTIHTDPQFTDAANGDFSIPEASVLYFFADDGGAIGDSRWAPPIGLYALNVFTDGLGSVALDPPGGVYTENTVVTLTATPDDYYAFEGWSPNVPAFPPSNPVVSITVTETMDITAYFVPTITEYFIEISSIGLGHVDATHTPQFPVDGYYEGDNLALVAVPDTTTWEFAYWVNAAMDSIDVGDIDYTIDADTSFIAYFRSTIDQVTLTTSFTGMGSIAISPTPVAGFTSYDTGTEITLNAIAPLGWEFTGWTGDLTSTDNPLVFTINADMALAASFAEISHPDGVLAVDLSWEILDAVEYAANNSQVTTLLLTSVGPYVPSEDLRVNGKMPPITLRNHLNIYGADTLAMRPLIQGYTSSTGGTSSEGFFRFRDGGSLTLKDLRVDGLMDGAVVPSKYIFRADDSAVTEFHCSLNAYNVDFKSTVEVFYKNYGTAYVDTMRFVDCVVSDIGKELIYLNTVGQADYVELTNSTFHNIGREIIYLKNMNPQIVVDHITIDSCGYGYGTEGDKFGAFRIENTTNVSFTNSIINDMPNTIYDYAMRISGENSIIDNILMNNVSMNIQNRDGATIGSNVFWYDPMFANETDHDYNLADASVAYHLADDGSAAIGDLKWATSVNVTPYNALNLDVIGEGLVMVVPEPMAKFYVPGTSVTASAAPDSLAQFDGWSGDVVSPDAAITFTMDADKSITATFSVPTYTLNLNVKMQYQIHIGTFNPATDSLDVAGSFNNWGADGTWLYDVDGDTVWSVAMVFPALSPDLNFEYKFRINASWDDATAEFPYGGPARVLNLTSDTTITVWYNDLDMTTSVDEHFMPEVYSLSQNFPNPFNPSTTISFDLIETADTRLILYDMRGREVEHLVNQNMAPGRYTVTFNGAAHASGVYFYRLTSGTFSDVKKLMLIK
ncbi:MAG: DUF5123 domain-containing protein [Candidatus Marinimicrobia bacterium]|nr:DUF5123 domain-containing protein [Candidatus Neomarinimicrobiota bacterium]